MSCPCSDQITNITKYDEFPETVSYFQEIEMMEVLKIPEVKPDIELITEMAVKPEVISVRLVKTKDALSYSGQNLTGYKVIVELGISKRVKYVADVPSQSVHSAHYDGCMKSAFIVVPKEVCNTCIESLIEHGDYDITPYLLFSNAQMRDERTIIWSAVILVDLVFCNCSK